MKPNDKKYLKNVWYKLIVNYTDPIHNKYSVR